MNKLPNHTALKEWASVIEALSRGEQLILIRKGGLADPHFGIEADRFYLYPTNYHEGGEESRTVPITTWCEVAHTWRLTDVDTLHRLEPLVVMDRATLDTRFRFRTDQAINIIAVRAFRLPHPVRIAARAAYEGCRSWISIDDEIGVDGSIAVLTEGDVRARIASIDALLTAAV